MTVTEEIEAYNEIHRKKKWEFKSFSLNEIPSNAKDYLETFLVPIGIEIKLHQPVIGKTFVFSIDHPTVKFLVHNTRGQGWHMWGDKNFMNITNDAAHKLLGTWGRVVLSPEQNN